MSKTVSSTPTITDIAKAAGVSITTVSRVLNNREDVAQGTRQRVQDVILRLGYTGNAAKHKLKQGVKHLALLVHSVDNEYWGEIIRGITDELDARTYRLTLHLTGAQVSQEATCIHIAQQTDTAGLLIVNPQMPENEVFRLMGKDLPFVLIDYYPKQAMTPCVRATNWQGTHQATDYLLGLGHRRIGVISGRENDKVVIVRRQGYQSALLEADIPIQTELLVVGDYSWSSGYQAANQLLSLPNRPTALIVFSDTMILGAIEAIKSAGFTIPDDISLIGFDDVPTIRQLRPAITTVRQPLYEMGRMGTQMLTTLVNGETLVSPQLVLPTQLIERESCRAIKI